MRILVLTKRQYTNKDIINDRYGRLYELPAELARLGHVVTGLCLSYRTRNEGYLLGPNIDGSEVDWHSVNLGKLIIPGLLYYQRKLHNIIKKFKPDIIFACSDAPHIILGVQTAKKYGIPCVVDIYDNFESFALTRIPVVLTLYRNSIRNASGVVAVSNPLKTFVEKEYRPSGKITVIPNGISTKTFHPSDRNDCRKKLGLPQNGKLIGTAGALGPSRGTQVLLHATENLIKDDPDVYLVMAGPHEKGFKIPKSANIYYMGVLEYELIPLLFNALDVGIICNKESDFGQFCFPQKAHEMLACNLPIVAANVGVMSEMLFKYPEILYSPESHDELLIAIRRQLYKPKKIDENIPTWSDLASNLEDFLLTFKTK